MSILNEKLPHSTTIDGKEYIINTDFRIWIKIEMLLQSRTQDRNNFV